MRRHAVAAGALAGLMVGLAGCGGGEDPAPAPSPEAAPTSAAPDETTKVYNPCDGLAPEKVADALGADVTMDEGSADSPRCAFNPDAEGGPVLDANYSLFPDGLDAIFESMTDLDAEDVQEINVPGADAARVVSDFNQTQLFLSGFVQNGDLIQTVDLVAPEPYDQQQLTRGLRLILDELSAHALEDPP